jgi:hypothetical protein
MDEYADYPGGENFEPWQDHEWPEHHEMPARYLGEVGKRELVELSGGKVEPFLREHSVDGEISMDTVPPHAPAPGEAWDSTVHHFRCVVCEWDMLLWDAN